MGQAQKVSRAESPEGLAKHNCRVGPGPQGDFPPLACPFLLGTTSRPQSFVRSGPEKQQNQPQLPQD